MYNSSKLVDGYALEGSFTTEWVDVRSMTLCSFSVVFTGGSPQGTAILEQSNDGQFTGGNRPNTKYSADAENSAGTVKVVDDSSAVASGNGAHSVAVSGAGVYKLDQRLIPFGWIRVKYTASSPSSTQLDIFLTVKNDR